MIIITDPLQNPLTVHFGMYQNNRHLAVSLYDAEGSLYATLSCNLDGDLGAGEFFVKNWSENEEIAVSALQSGVFIDTGRRVGAGFVEVPIWRLADMVNPTIAEHSTRAFIRNLLLDRSLTYALALTADACREIAKDGKD